MIKEKLIKLLSAKDIVGVINERLETTWTDNEWKAGKKVEVKQEWCGRINFIVSEYRKKGWFVKKEAMICSDEPFRYVYLLFRNPSSFKDCPPELRTTGV
tara:strand:- start:613 stop:912 length:300 start_codon:yes stop_codon:yes gene_type:complete